MQQDHKYTAADLERYHSGKMSVGEMHALEKAAMQDPFLADALDGYIYTPTPIKDVAELREKLFAKKKEKKVFFLVSKQNTWLRIAALFILIAGIGYMAYQLNTGKESNMLSIKEKSNPEKNQTLTPVIKPDSSINQKEGFTHTSPTVSGNGSFKKENRLPEADLQTSEGSSEAPKEYLTDQVVHNDVVSQLQGKVGGVNILKGRVVDTSGNPIRYATIRGKDKNVITSSDSTGRFKIPANDSSITAVVSVIGYETKEKQLNRNGEEVIVMEPNKRALEEVVVTSAYGKRREKKSLGYATTNVKQAELTPIDSNSNPMKGWNAFNDYLQKNIVTPTNAEGNNYKGIVILSFEINKRGNPQKIKVVQSLCEPCDEEAIRLLRNGPKWKYTNSNKQTVTIQF